MAIAVTKRVPMFGDMELMEIIADAATDVANLPTTSAGATDFDGNTIGKAFPGSKATIAGTGAVYLMDTTGSWEEQP